MKSLLLVPGDDPKPWPSLGGEICDLIEDELVHGPGDLLGQKPKLDDETRWLIWRLYEVYPKDHPQAGRRRFKRGVISLRKGTAKTEKAAWIAAVEAHPEGPVRCTGWRHQGSAWIPVGGPVTDPYIPMVAYTEQQSEELAYGALVAILERSPAGRHFDVSQERIKRVDGTGKVVPLASAPDARDGARTTFEHFDETEHFDMPRLREAHRTMILNLPKRKAADAWALETAVAPVPGAGSVAEASLDYGRQVASGAIKDSRLFLIHRQASERHDLETYNGLHAAVLEASGPYADWADVEGIESLWQDPAADRAMLAQRWLNQMVPGRGRAFDAEAWKASDELREIAAGRHITLGFDGSRVDDSTALIASDIETGYQWPIGIWYPDRITGEIDVDLVEVALDEAFTTFEVWRLYADPWKWELYVRRWAGKYGTDRVVEFWTNAHLKTARAVRNYANAIARGEVPHDPDPLFAEHIGNAHKRELNERDEDGQRLWVIQKERHDSVHKIDAAMAGSLANEARTHALAMGILVATGPSVYEARGVRWL